MATTTNEDRALRRDLTDLFAEITTPFATLDNVEREVRRSGSDMKVDAIELINTLRKNLNASKNAIIKFKSKYYR